MSTFSDNNVLVACLKYFHGDELASRVWINKYALKDSQGHLYEATPTDMHHRLANEFARIEAKYPNGLSAEKIFQLLDQFKYIVPQGGPMSGIGNKLQVSSLSNCFVIGVPGHDDSYGAIMKLDEEQVQLMKRRGGVGHDLSGIRPKGSPVNNSALTSTGIVPFMDRYSRSTREVAQDGRRGALMLSIALRHPDAADFIDAKVETDKITGANISVKIDDDFMRAVVSDGEYTQQYPTSGAVSMTKTIRARDLWKKIVHNAWLSAEPGVLFWDTIIRESVPDCYADSGFTTVSTNPCGEIPLCPYDSCRLLALNLYNYVNDPFTPQAHINYTLLAEHAQYAQRLLDDLIDLEIEKIDTILAKITADPECDDIKRTERELWEKIRAKSLLGRRTGLSTTAEGDMLAALGLKYGTDVATDVSEEVHKTIALAAYRSSVTMAQERGPFELYDPKKELQNPFIQRLKAADEELYTLMTKVGRRNIACLTIAPTGTTSIMTQTTSGIEPVFNIIYKRKRKINPNDKKTHVDFVDETGDSFEEYSVLHPKFVEWLHRTNQWKDIYTDEELQTLVRQSPYWGADANAIDWAAKVRMQGRIQKWIDHSISVTINLPKDVTEEVVNELYIEAWKCGCKGCTVYRDGCRNNVLEATPKKKPQVDKDCVCFDKSVRIRPEVLDCDVIRFQNQKEKWVAFVGLYEGAPYEIFTGLDDENEGLVIPKSITKGRIVRVTKTDGTHDYNFEYTNQRGITFVVGQLNMKFNKEFWNYARFISGVMRYKMPLVQIINIVHGLNIDDDNINSWKSGVERALKRYLVDGATTGQVCPECGQPLIYEEGCMHCTNCGYSKCGG